MTAENIPIVLFTYKKTTSIQKILNQLLFVKSKVIYVVFDLGETETDKIRTQEVKQIIYNHPLHKNCKYITPSNHQGIIRVFDYALDIIFKQEEQAIILEDDTIPSESFFDYCEIMLDKYRNDKSIGSIVGTNLGTTTDENAYFKAPIGLPYWGWATWADRWTKMPKNFSFWDRFTDSNAFKQLLVTHESFMEPLIRNRQQPKSWDLKWTMFQLSQNMKTVLPGINLITNDGYHELATFTRIENSEFANMKRHRTDGNKFRLSKPNQSILLLYEEAQRKFMLEFATRKQVNT